MQIQEWVKVLSDMLIIGRFEAGLLRNRFISSGVIWKQGNVAGNGVMQCLVPEAFEMAVPNDDDDDVDDEDDVDVGPG